MLVWKGKHGQYITDFGGAGRGAMCISKGTKAVIFDHYYNILCGISKYIIITGIYCFKITIYILYKIAIYNYI